MSATGHEVSFWSDENVLSLDCCDNSTTLNMLKTVHFNWVDFIVCDQYFRGRGTAGQEVLYSEDH